jgi:ABC-type lipoprotein export system ATPase subunit
MTPALSFRGVSRVYRTGAGSPRFALRDVSFELAAGQRIAVVGRSGSGKSTLLHLAAGIDLASAGAVAVEGRDLAALSDRARTLLRREAIGLVFQFFHLLPHLPVADNVALPALIAGDRPAAYRPRIAELLARVGLADRAGDPVQQLSGGEQQRVAICRALLRRPRLLLADEPTGNLDDVASRTVMDAMLALARDEGSALLYVTHSRELAGLADETWRLHSGELTARAGP